MLCDHIFKYTVHANLILKKKWPSRISLFCRCVEFFGDKYIFYKTNQNFKKNKEVHIEGLKALCSAKNSKQATSKTRFTNKKRGPFKLCKIKFYYLVFPPCDLESEGGLMGTLLTKLHNVREDLHQVWQRSLAKLHSVREKIITLVGWMLITTKDQRVCLVPTGHIKIHGNKNVKRQKLCNSSQQQQRQHSKQTNVFAAC